MEDLFKKFINAGVGFVSLTSDRVQTTIDALVRESKLSEEEGKKIMDDLKKNSETKRKELEQQFSSIATKLMKSVGVASNSDVEELKRSVKGGAKSSSGASTAASGSKSGSSKTAAKPASSTTAKAAGATKKAADKVSSAAGTAQKSSAAKAGAAKSSGGSKSGGAKKDSSAAPAAGTDTAGA